MGIQLSMSHWSYTFDSSRKVLCSRADQTLLLYNATAALITHTGLHDALFNVRKFMTVLNNLKFTWLQVELVCCNTMLIVESAIAILNVIAGMPKIYVRSVEILTADCWVVGIRLLAVAFLDLRFPQWQWPLSFSLVISTLKNLQKGFIYKSTLKVKNFIYHSNAFKCLHDQSCIVVDFSVLLAWFGILGTSCILYST
jgi:hypothetical protein